ncbi:glycerol-3-phosphate dehydrogenase [Oceanospirillum multiglobuliferum]|uniref:FAD-dependent oxidoreductase n=1 Tax=Oceanospirillum multiglobuliferum TaxID=64969 RepID=A0A1T4PS87_9GAMM|nr:glycerol-3-phosphate dehydrogenase/oxidase [Oceanospirillum multiglobuliferum]OPX55346.1 hypothetical protein BTE48_09275 [Oceanospirillum multiglobuliferum]SJZ94289.1 glycerol-3-phosphate dehydrogenase [Oceanospirillum multiglobuliferum]
MLPVNWTAKGRAGTMAELTQQDWDIVIIGGGISGAGLLFEASRRGYKALLLEQNDFASGSSSRSSKLVHGGIRYLATGQFRLTRDAVKAREKLCKQLPGLVDHLKILMPHYKDEAPSRLSFRLLMWFYDALAGKRYHRGLTGQEAKQALPQLKTQQLYAATEFQDAVTDDAFLTLRVLLEASFLGGVAYNYCQASDIQSIETPRRYFSVKVTPEDMPAFRVRCKQVIHAEGAWTKSPDASIHQFKVRPLRGSHLLISARKLPLTQALCLFHPDDNRLMFALPWQGQILAGTTDLDHKSSLGLPVRMQPEEQQYLLKALNHYFPASALTERDCISAWSGVRPVLSKLKADNKPSAEAREHQVWWQNGQLYLCGGKLTTFQKMATDAINQITFKPDIPISKPWRELGNINQFDASTQNIPENIQQRYGVVTATALHQFEPVSKKLNSSLYYEAEIVWHLTHFSVQHLDDLMLRRTHLGLLLPEGGQEVLPTIKSLCVKHLGWTEAHWQLEKAKYLSLIEYCYQPYRAKNRDEKTGA